MELNFNTRPANRLVIQLTYNYKSALHATLLNRFIVDILKQ